MGGLDSAVPGESRTSCLVDLEIPLLASFPYLLGGAERVLYGQWSGQRVIVGAFACRRYASFRARHDLQLRSIPGRVKREHRRHALVRSTASALRCRGRPGSLTTSRDPIRGHRQVGSLTGAVHLSKNNAGVLRPAQRGRKPRVEQKGKSWLDPRRSVRVGTAKASAYRSSRPLKSFQREVSEKLPQG